MTLYRIYSTGDAPTVSLVGGITNSATSFTANSSTNYPSHGPFVVVIDKGTASEEKVKCDSATGGVFAVSSGGRGFDGTVAAAHGNGAFVQHVVSALQFDDENDHVYNTGRDDHTQYLLTSGTRPVTGPFIASSTLTVDGTLTAAAAFVAQSTAQITGAATLSSTLNVAGASTLASASVTGNETVGGTLGVTGNTTVGGTLGVTGAVTGSSTVTGTALIPSGLTGATTGARYVGSTASGAPVSGTFSTGDWITTQDGHIFICTSGGTSGTWVDPTTVTDDAAYTAVSGGVGFLNSWSQYGSTRAVGYRKMHGTQVWLRGNVAGGTPSSSSVIFTLPSGYRPSAACNFPVASNNLYGTCAIASNGNVTAYSGSGTYFSLDGIIFDTL